MDTADPIADLDSKSPEELDELEQQLVSQFDAADEADDLDTMSAVADQITAVRAAKEAQGGNAEGSPDEEASESPADEAAEPPGTDSDDPKSKGNPFAKGKKPVAASASPPEGGADADEAEADTEGTDTDVIVEGEPDPRVSDGTDADGDQPEESAKDAEGADTTSTSGEPASGSSESAATTASGESTKEDKVDNADIPEDRQPVVATASNEILAGTDIPGFAAGLPFTDRMSVATAFEKRLDTVKRATGGDDTQHIVATITASAPPERTLDPNDIEGNLAKIEDVTRKEAITAAGGYCAPLETRYDIFGTGTTDRPVRDALAGFQARRGGIRYTAAPKITDFAGASGLWTAANDANPTAPATKPCLTVVCQPEVTAMVDAVTLCLKFGNLMTRAYPELIDRNNQLALVAHARYAERALLSKLTALSVSVTSAFRLGTARDFLNAVGRAATAYRHRYRMEPTQPLRILVPIWVRDAVREDLAMQMPGDNALEIADTLIDQQLRARNVNPSWHLDAPGFADEVEASTLDDFPASFEWYIFAEGSFIFLDGGTLDLGIVRDSTLVATNDYKTFTESFEGVARIGAESVRVTTTTKPAGATAGTVATTP